MGKIAKWIAVALSIVILGLLLALFIYSRLSQPQIDGRISVDGLSAPVDIVRDGRGVPHIYAREESDAWFALGFAHAQDRLWQMEFNRRLSSGRLAEILGSAAAGTDRFMRTLGVRRSAEGIFQHMADDTRTILQAYADGVNAYLKSQRGPLPPEFLITGATAPALWEPADSIAWQIMMAWDLGSNWSQEVLRMRLAQRLSLQQINEFLPPYPGEDPVPTRDYAELYDNLAGLAAHMRSVAALAPSSHVEGKGSNAWNVSGELTASGKPLLANDPHLGLSAPSLWYFAHLSAPGLEVVGATIPGAPSVILGHNTRIAWGFTNTASDVQDLYIERLNPDNPAQYQTPSGWAEFKRRTEVIKVKGEADQVLVIRESRHGPVVSGVLPVVEKTGLDDGHVMAFAWTALRPDNMTLQATIRMNRAQGWAAFLNAVQDFHAPQQNIHYADREGNVGFVAPGRVPVRGENNDLMGLAPAPGWEARYDWQGFIPFDALPRSFNPSSGRIVTANEKIVGDDYPYFLGNEWALPYRAQRIHGLLDEVTHHSVESFAGIQADDLSLAARELLPLLLKAKPASERATYALGRLSRWDGRMARDAVAPLIYNAWVRQASRLIFEDELGEMLMRDYWELRNVYQPMVNVLKDVDGQSRWCGGNLSGTSADCGQLLTQSLEAALDDLERRYGTNMAGWTWGEAHEARMEHRPFSRNAWLAPLFDIRIPSPGDTYTVNVGRHSLGNEDGPFTNRHAASLRAIYDLDNLDNSRFMHTTGQVGNVLSSGYRSFAEPWVEVQYFTIPMQRNWAEADGPGTLTLSPS
jgi:penicillin amidase